MDSCNKMIAGMTQEELWAKLKERVNRPGHFSADAGIEITEVGDHWSRGVLTVTQSSMNPRNIVHGGCLCTLMDTAAGVAACTGGRACVTLNCSLNYLRPAAGTEKVYCETKLVKNGRTVVVMEAVLTDGQGKEIASGTYTFFLLEDLSSVLENKEFL